MKSEYEHLIPFGYASGKYIIKCYECGEQPCDMNKLARRCKSCAQIKYDINERRLELRRLPNFDTNTRQLKRLGSLGAWSTGKDKDVCDHCALRNICDSNPVKTCFEFMPVLPFQDEVGFTEGNVVNTVRVGKAWVDRLTTGSTVALFNVKTKLIFSYARVIGLDSGLIDNMLRLHAAINHLFVDTPSLEAPALLKNWQLRTYGPRIVNDRTTLTVIYLLPQPGEVSAPIFHNLKD